MRDGKAMPPPPDASQDRLLAAGLISGQEVKERLRAFELDGTDSPPVNARLRLSLSVAGRVQGQIEVSLSPAPPLFVEVPSSLVSLAAAEETGKSLLSLVTECVREGYRLGRSETHRARGEA